MVQVRQLLDTYGNDLEKSVRIGDLFSIITEHYMNLGDLEKARSTVEELRRLKPEIQLSYFYNFNVLKSLGYHENNFRDMSLEENNTVEEL